MRVKLNTRMAGAQWGNHEPGAVVDLPDDIARGLVESRQAEAVPGEAAPPAAPPAAAEPPADEPDAAADAAAEADEPEGPAKRSHHKKPKG